MGQYLNPGNGNFAGAVGSKVYVDKTGMLQVTNSLLGTEQRWMCVTRPRRFGKSMTARMLAAYYSKGCDSRELFAPYAIAHGDEPGTHFEEHLNKYDVIQLDITSFIIKSINSGCELPLEKIVSFIQSEVIAELTSAYPEYVRPGETILSEALSDINLHTGLQFVIIVDEWDALFREDKFNIKLQESYVSLLRSLFKTEQAVRFTKFAYITGIFPVKKYGTQSALNNFWEYSMLNAGQLAPYIGFTDDEVKALCERFDMNIDEVREWYDGYTVLGVGGKIWHMYTSQSIIQAMSNRFLDGYWCTTDSYEMLVGYISSNFDGLKDTIIALLGGERCEVDTGLFQNDLINIKNRDQVLTLLIHLGYLAYDRIEKKAFIPNREVRSEFERAVKDTGWTGVTEALKESRELLEATWEQDSDTVAEILADIHEDAASVLRRSDENSLACAITLAYYAAQDNYVMFRELPRGRGFADIVYLPKNNSPVPALVIELKWDQFAQAAIEQIKNKKYTKHLQDFSGRLLLVGINYDKEEGTYQCEIDEWEK